jgi:hypothetical protein
MRLPNVIEGLQIFAKYYYEPEYELGADHDIVYVYSTDIPLSTEDLARVYELGFFQPEAEDTEDENTGECTRNYDAEEGWAFHV